MGLVDAHLHLPLVANPLGTASAAGMLGMRLFSASTNVGDTLENLRLREANPATVRFFAGVHPSEVRDSALGEKLEALIRRADGIGEIGLDPKYSAVSRDGTQFRMFIAQLELAEKEGKPVQVHSRGAEREVLDVLGSFRLRSVLLHWFEGDELTVEAFSRGYYISFGPALLYSKRLRRMAERYPADLILSESDAPVTYRPLGSSISGPLLIPSVLFALSEAIGKGYADAELRISENASRFLPVGP